MSANQTIDGVPRDDLELVLLHGHSTHESDRAWDRLRALLEAPPRCPVCGYTEQDCREQMDHYLCGSPEPAPANKRAAQPQGEPVACAICLDLGDQCLECEEAAFVSWANRHFASADYRKTNAGVYIQDWMRHAFAAWQARKSEQPAPVAEQLIERLAKRFPDLENMYTAEVFADWLRAELNTK